MNRVKVAGGGLAQYTGLNDTDRSGPIVSAKSFPIVLEPDKDGGYVVSCPILPGCYSQGDSIHEALENIKEAIEMCLDELRDSGQDIPNPDGVTVGSVVVEL